MNTENQNTGDILLYQDQEGKTAVEVKLEKETVWLNLNQIAELFQRDKSVISRHIRNIFSNGELSKSVVAKNATTASDGKIYDVDYYNLDMIISVGYRVNSKRGTQFRIRATQRLKDYLIKGFAINQKRLEETKLNELEHMVALIKKNIDHKGLSHKETAGLLNVITHYTHSRILLQKYDEESLSLPEMHDELKAELTYTEAVAAVDEMKRKFLPKKAISEFFGIERNNEFKGILQSIYQSFDGQALYPSIEEKAVQLLFSIIKNHPFSDGNKKIGAFLFLRFLAKNGCLYHIDGSKKIDDATVVAITLLVATCNPDHKDMITKLILNFLVKVV